MKIITVVVTDTNLCVCVLLRGFSVWMWLNNIIVVISLERKKLKPSCVVVFQLFYYSCCGGKNTRTCFIFIPSRELYNTEKS